MVNGPLYVPVLRWKAGEEYALRHLSPEAKSATVPLLMVDPHEYDPPDHSEVDDTFDALMSRDVEKLRKAWPEGRAYVDLSAIDGGALVRGQEHPVSYFFREARQRDLDVVPVVEIGAEENYVAAVAEAARGGDGVMLRLFFEDLDDYELAAAIREQLEAVRLRPENVDLVLDLKMLRHPVARAVQAALRDLYEIGQWRSVTLAAGAMPQTLAEYARRIHRIPREDWHLWLRLSQLDGPRLRYGDYCTVSAEPGDAIDPRLMNPSASVKYTLADEWLLIRGAGIKTPGAGGCSQFVDHARLLVQTDEYAGPDFSYGDAQIQRIANNDGRPGSPRTWVSIGVNHHIELAVRQLHARAANLRAA